MEKNISENIQVSKCTNFYKCGNGLDIKHETNYPVRSNSNLFFENTLVFDLVKISRENCSKNFTEIRLKIPIDENKPGEEFIILNIVILINNNTPKLY